MRHNRTVTRPASGGRRSHPLGALDRWALLLLMGLLVALPVPAQDIAVSTEQPDLGREPQLRLEDGTIQLSLEDAIAIALERNLSLVVERYFTDESELNVLANLGIYDVFTTFDLASLDETSPAASNLDGAPVQEFRQDTANLAVRQLVPTGGTVRFDWLNNKQDTNSTFATLNPNYRVDMDLHFVQPLLRNLGRLATERNLRIARNNENISLENFEQQVTIIILRVEEAYWNLAESIAQLAVAEEALDLAVQLHEQNKIRVEVGTLAPLELVQSEAGIADREVDIIRARAAVGDRADVLRQLLNLEQEGDSWKLPIRPTSDPFEEHSEIDVDAAIATALARRPELRAKQLQLENQEIDVVYFRNQKKPRLDFVGTYGYNGLGGDVLLREGIGGPVIEVIPGGYGDAIEQILDTDFEGWRAALNFAYPIQNRTAKANSAIAQVSYERGIAELRDLELGVITEVRRVARALDAAAEAVDAAEVNRRLQQRNYEAEQKRYDNGMSTSFQVLQIQEDLSDARSRFVAAVAAYRRALALHYQSLGTLIAESGVEIED